MGYNFYIDDFLLPISPSKMVTKVANKNQTISLINSQEINILKPEGLVEIEFDFILPDREYPFTKFKNGYLPPSYFLEKLKNIKLNKKSVRFTVLREKSKKETMHNLNMRVSIEDYTVSESFEDGYDSIVSIKLKQFYQRSTKTGMISKDKDEEVVIVVKENRPFYEEEKKTYILKRGDNLFDICHMILGDGDLCRDIAEKNGLKSPFDAVEGMLIRFDL